MRPNCFTRRGAAKEVCLQAGLAMALQPSDCKYGYALWECGPHPLRAAPLWFAPVYDMLQMACRLGAFIPQWGWDGVKGVSKEWR